MATRGEVEFLRSANRGVVVLATRDLQAFWSALNTDRPEVARDALLRFVPVLVERYGEAAAAVAADWYDDLRAAAGARGAYRARIADADPVASTKATRYAAGHLFTGAPNGTLDYLMVAISKLVLQPSRDTLVRAAGGDPGRPRWARVPSGAETCAFCLVMASRGFVYRTAESAGDRNRWHGKCDCQIVPDWSDDPRLDGYDPDALYAKYQEATAQAGTNRLKGAGSEEDGDLSILQALRREQGIN